MIKHARVRDRLNCSDPMKSHKRCVSIEPQEPCRPWRRTRTGLRTTPHRFPAARGGTGVTEMHQATHALSPPAPLPCPRASKPVPLCSPDRCPAHTTPMALRTVIGGCAATGAELHPASVRITRMGDADLPRVARGCLLGRTAACRLHLRGVAGRMRSAEHIGAGSRHGAAPRFARWVREGRVPMNAPSTTSLRLRAPEPAQFPSPPDQ